MNLIKSVRVFLLFLIVIGVGLLLTQKIWVPKVVNMILKDQKNEIINSATTVDQTSNLTSTLKDEITNWKTYKNTTYGFSIKYPNNFNLIEDGTMLNGQSVWQSLWDLPESYYQNSKISDVEFEINVTTGSCNLSGKKATINGIDFYVTSNDSGFSEDSTEDKSQTYSTEIKFVCYEISVDATYSDNNLLVYNPSTAMYEVADKNTMKKIEDQTIEDEGQISTIFDEFVSTFKFTN